MRKQLAERMRKAGWARSKYDDTLRSRLYHGVNDMQHWSDWGHLTMWLTGRYDSGSAGIPRGRDLWWVPAEYIEGDCLAMVDSLEIRYGCYVTQDYTMVRVTKGRIPWRIFDLQDGGNTVKVGLWPNEPEHNGRIQPLPWNELGPKTSLALFLHWYLIDHKVKSQWLGLRTRLYSKALSAAVDDRRPFTCQAKPGPGGYAHWTCQLRKRHEGDHRYRNYVWRRDVDARAEFSLQR